MKKRIRGVMKGYLKFKNLHLILSILIVAPIALIYGLFQEQVLPLFFDFHVETTDLKNVFRAIMFLYLGMVLIWIQGILKPELWETATLVNIVFMGGLGLGRLLSLLLDGIPSPPFAIGLIGELALAFLGFYQFKKAAQNTHFIK